VAELQEARGDSFVKLKIKNGEKFSVFSPNKTRIVLRQGYGPTGEDDYEHDFNNQQVRLITSAATQGQ
jgi:hypothetical protein